MHPPKLDKNGEELDDYDEDEDDYERPTVLPPVPDAVSYLEPNNLGSRDRAEKGLPPINHTLRGRNLQVIVKLADIVLGPRTKDDAGTEEGRAKLRYDGGSWHVEGMINESIVATGIYYYHSEGITRSDLAFRTGIEEPNYEQNDRNGVQLVYGLEDEGPLVMELGAIETKEGRAVVFPNLHQHQVQPFGLLEEAERGLRKILVFFFCDPTVPIISTSRVPPQQKSWLLQPLDGLFSRIEPTGIPPEITEKIVEAMEWPMGEDEAKAHRATLMAERSNFVKVNGENVFQREFSLCEH